MTTHASPSLSERYQAATNYTPDSIQGHPGLDFSRQPSAFKTWHQARRVVLDRGQAEARASADGGALDASRLGRLLFHTYGVTLVREMPGMSMHYRAAPSAGGLYPTELYVAVRDVVGIPDGIFAYDAQEHALVVCWEGDFGDDLARHAFAHPAARGARVMLIGTGLYERSAWRYGDRAYRRVLLDTGHVFGNAVVAAPSEGLRVVPLAAFHDAALENLLLIDPAVEGALLLAAVLDATDDAATGDVRRSDVARHSETPTEGNWIAAVHAAGRMSEPLASESPWSPGLLPPACAPAVELPPTEDLDTDAAPHLIRHRRSTRAFAQARIPVDALSHVLTQAYTDRGARLAPGVLTTWIVTFDIEGVPDGVHRYDEDAHALLPVRLGHARDALHRCCLWQELGRDCAFAVIHTVDLPAAVARYGERIYRTVHLDAGLLGQRLNLGALHAGLGASGIGGYFDAHLGELLAAPPQHAIVYVTTIGVPAAE